MARPGFVEPEARRNEVLAFVRNGLEDVSVSRTAVAWGIPVPADPRHTIYVWIDALSNYITGLGYGTADAALYRQFWPASLHVIGKDIARFHAVIWPALLLALGEPLPGGLLVHGWLHLSGEKISKSLGNVIDPHHAALARDPAAADGLAGVLYDLAETLRLIAVLLEPFLVTTPAGIYAQLGLDPTAARPALWADATRWGLLPPGTVIRRGAPLFPRIVTPAPAATGPTAVATE